MASEFLSYLDQRLRERAARERALQMLQQQKESQRMAAIGSYIGATRPELVEQWLSLPDLLSNAQSLSQTRQALEAQVGNPEQQAAATKQSLDTLSAIYAANPSPELRSVLDIVQANKNAAQAQAGTLAGISDAESSAVQSVSDILNDPAAAVLSNPTALSAALQSAVEAQRRQQDIGLKMTEMGFNRAMKLSELERKKREKSLDLAKWIVNGVEKHEDLLIPLRRFESVHRLIFDDKGNPRNLSATDWRAIVVAFASSLDPNSAVMLGEAEAVEQAKTYIDRLKDLARRVVNEKVDPDVANVVYNTMRRLVKIYADAYDRQTRTYRQMIRSELPPDIATTIHIPDVSYWKRLAEQPPKKRLVVYEPSNQSKLANEVEKSGRGLFGRVVDWFAGDDSSESVQQQPVTEPATGPAYVPPPIQLSEKERALYDALMSGKKLGVR